MTNKMEVPEFTEFKFGEVEAEAVAKLSEEIAGDKDAMMGLIVGTRYMEQAKDLDEQAKAIKEKADKLRLMAEDHLAPLFLSYGLRGAEGDFGNLSFYYGTQSKLNKKVLQAELIKAKVKLQVVVAAMSKATKTTTNNKLSIQLKRPEE